MWRPIFESFAVPSLTTREIDAENGFLMDACAQSVAKVLEGSAIHA
jgi:hypothetical protein